MKKRKDTGIDDDKIVDILHEPHKYGPIYNCMLRNSICRVSTNKSEILPTPREATKVYM
jgi:hypothetical protein